MLTPDLANRFMRLTLGQVGREFPFKLDHVMEGPHDVVAPRALHPLFHGSFDWHSCVHGWWQLITLAWRFPGSPEAAEVRARADALFVAPNVAGELACLARPSSATFERPYGWAWLLALHGEAARHDAPWAAALEPLARAFAGRFRSYLPKLTYPIRAGTHGNTAFALALARRWAERFDPMLAAIVVERALAWFDADRDCAAWEPSGDDFLSPALCEAALMGEVFGIGSHGAWFDRFLPRAAQGEPATLFTPVHVSDRSDGTIAHLDGLNLSRAWCWRRIARALPAGHDAIAVARDAAGRHLAAALPHIAGDYAGAHWLATFALLALLEG